MNTTSPELLNKLRTLKDQDAWDAFVHIYYKTILRWIHEAGYDYNETETEDLVQEVFLTIYRKIENFERERKGSLRKWLKLIVYNIVLRKKSKDKNKSHLSLDTLAETPQMENSCDKFDDRSELIDQAIQYVKKDFSVQSWKSFELVYFHGKSPRDAAQELLVTENAVYIATSRILARIRSVIDRFVDNE